MGRKIKEEEMIEKAIRALIRLPDNRRCINCHSLGPQYVCTTFWTFICTTCSGIHREFTHRVKSISMARFTAEEVSALRAAGNEQARQIYFKGWDPQSNALPDGSNLRRLRDFIKNVYVDRLYTGERGQISLPSVRTRLMEDQVGRKAFAHASESRRSSSFDNRENSSYRGRFSPLMKAYKGSFQGFIEERNTNRHETLRSRSSLRGTPRFEVVDHRIRHSVSRCGESGASRLEKDLGENGLSSKGGENSNAKAHKEFDALSDIQILPSTNVAKQTVNLKSLIDFGEDGEPSGDTGSPSNGTCSKEKEDMAPSADTLESLLFGCSVTDVAPSTSAQQHMRISSRQNSLAEVGATDVFFQPCDTSNVDFNPNVRASDQPQLAVVPQYPTSSAFDSSFTPQESSEQFKTLGCLPSHNVPSSSAMNEQPSWAISNSGVDNSSAVQTNGGRKELPPDLFSGNYMPEAAALGWQTRQCRSTGFDQPYHCHAMSLPAYPNASRSYSRNPFDDYSSESCPAQPTEFSLASLQEISPVTCSLVPQQSPYHTSMAPSAFMGQAAHTSVPPSRLIETGDMQGDIFGSQGLASRSTTGEYFVTTQQNTSSVRGGNPFW